MTKRDPRMPRALPPRVEKRPSPDQWSPTEILTLNEAAHLMWPEGGPLTLTSLRKCVRDHRLDFVRINGKILTCRAALERMLACSPRSDVPAAECTPVRSGSIAEMQRRYLDRFAK